VLTGALPVGTAAAFTLLTVAATGLGGLPALPAALWTVLATAGPALPNAPALSRHGESAGTASGLLGAVQFGVGALAAPLVGTGAVAMAILVVLGMSGAVTVLLTVVRPSRAEPAVHTP
jgi:DHA1 family bicyclomycin/chloramphenicol resistance-like MFS transporter